MKILESYHCDIDGNECTIHVNLALIKSNPGYLVLRHIKFSGQHSNINNETIDRVKYYSGYEEALAKFNVSKSLYQLTKMSTKDVTRLRMGLEPKPQSHYESANEDYFECRNAYEDGDWC